MAHRVEPVGVQDLLAVGPLGHEHGPLAAVLAGGVLPLGLHALLEQVEVRPRPQPARRLDVVVQAATRTGAPSGYMAARRMSGRQPWSRVRE